MAVKVLYSRSAKVTLNVCFESVKVDCEKAVASNKCSVLTRALDAMKK